MQFVPAFAHHYMEEEFHCTDCIAEYNRAQEFQVERQEQTAMYQCVPSGAVLMCEVYVKERYCTSGSGSSKSKLKRQ